MEPLRYWRTQLVYIFLGKRLLSLSKLLPVEHTHVVNPFFDLSESQPGLEFLVCLHVEFEGRIGMRAWAPSVLPFATRNG